MHIYVIWYLLFTTGVETFIDIALQISPNLQGHEPDQQQEFSYYGPIEPLCHPFFEHLKRHFQKEPHVLQVFIDTMQAFACNLWVCLWS